MMYQVVYKSSNRSALFLYQSYLQKLFSAQNCSKFSISALPQARRRVTLYKAPHVYKKAKEQFECRTFAFSLTFWGNTTFFKLFLLNCPKDLHVIVKTQV